MARIKLTHVRQQQRIEIMPQIMEPIAKPLFPPVLVFEDTTDEDDDAE